MPRYIRFIGFLHYGVYVLNQAKSLDESVQLLLTVCTVLSSPMLCLPWRPLFPLFSWKLLCSALVFIGPTTPNLRSLSFIVNDYMMMCHSSPCSSYYILGGAVAIITILRRVLHPQRTWDPTTQHSSPQHKRKDRRTSFVCATVTRNTTITKVKNHHVS